MGSIEFAKAISDAIGEAASKHNRSILNVEVDLARRISSIEKREKPLTHYSIQHMKRGNLPDQNRIGIILRYLNELGVDQATLEEIANKSGCDYLLKESLLFARDSVPKRDPNFLNREDYISELLKVLAPEHRAYTIVISGIGGVGKTALAKELVHKLLENNAHADTPWDGVVWMSAKSSEQFLGSEHAEREAFRDLDTLYNCIDNVLNTQIKRVTPDKRLAFTQDILAKRRILLVIDNLDDVYDDGINKFLRDLPSPSKALITTRIQQLDGYQVALRGISPATAQNLVDKECSRLSLELEDATKETIINYAYGLPLVITHTLIRIKELGATAENEIDRLIHNNTSLYSYIFGDTLELLKSLYPQAHDILLAMALLAGPTTDKRIAHIASVNYSVDIFLSHLISLSLIYENMSLYCIEPFVKGWLLTYLRQEPALETLFRERWIKEYTELVQVSGGKDRQDAYKQYSILETEIDNIFAVLEYHVECKNIDAAWNMWRQLRNFSQVLGHWAKRETFLRKLLVYLKQRQENWEDIVFAQNDLGFTLTLMGDDKLIEAEELLKSAWNFNTAHVPNAVRVRIANNLAGLFIRRFGYSSRLGDLDEAVHWLNSCRSILETELSGDNNLPTTLHESFLRVNVFYLFNRAKVAYYLFDFLQRKTRESLNELERFTEFNFENDENEHGFKRIFHDLKNMFSNETREIVRDYTPEAPYEHAKQTLEEVVNLANLISWQRVFLYAQNWLIEIEIRLMNADAPPTLYQPIKDRIQGYLEVTIENKDWRRTAAFYRMLSQLHGTLGEADLACSFAENAVDIYEKLNMRSEVEELRHWLAIIEERQSSNTVGFTELTSETG